MLSSQVFAPKPFKIPESVLVVIYTPALDVLLIKRADAPDYWQSVTGSKDFISEAFDQTARREVAEETGINCAAGSMLAENLCDWQLENIYEIYPRWRHRYAPGVIHNTCLLYTSELKMSVDEALTYVISMGSVTPGASAGVHPK